MTSREMKENRLYGFVFFMICTVHVQPFYSLVAIEGVVNVKEFQAFFGCQAETVSIGNNP